MTLDLAALKRTAEAANVHLEMTRTQPAGFRSVFDPQTCLALIARAEQADALERERDAAQQRYNEQFAVDLKKWHEARADANAFKSERDIARENGAFLERMREQRDFHMREHDKADAEVARLRAALEHIARTRGRNGHTATAIINYVREVLEGAKKE